MQKTDIFLVKKNKDWLPTKLNDFKAGFELEFESRTDISRVCKKLDIPNDKISIQTIEHNFNGVKVIESKDLFKTDSLFTYGYVDGSISCEMVTNAFDEDKVLMNLQKAYKIINDNFITPDYYYNGKGGLHLTIINGKHKDDSVFSATTQHNVLRFFNAFYDSILLAFANGNEEKPTRNTSFRQLRNAYQIVRNKQHYVNSMNTIWGLEFRFPDSTNDYNSMDLQTKFCVAVIKESNNIAKGNCRLFIKQEQFIKQKAFQDLFNGTNDLRKIKSYYIDNKERLDFQNKLLLELLANELNDKEIYEEIKKLFDFQKRYVDNDNPKNTLLRHIINDFYKDKKANKKEEKEQKLYEEIIKEKYGKLSKLEEIGD